MASEFIGSHLLSAPNMGARFKSEIAINSRVIATEVPDSGSKMKRLVEGSNQDALRLPVLSRPFFTTPSMKPSTTEC